MVGENRETDCNSRGGIPTSTNIVCMADDTYSSVSRDASVLENLITRLEDETGNSNSLNTEIAEENGISVVTKFLIKDQEEETCSLQSSIETENTEVIRKDGLLVVTDDCNDQAQAIASEEVEMDFVDKRSDDIGRKCKANDRDCQPYISVQQGPPDGGGVGDPSMENLLLDIATDSTNHASPQSNTDHSDKVITNKDLTVETVSQSSGDIALNAPVKSGNEFTYEWLNEDSLVETQNTEDHTHRKYRNDLSMKEPVGAMVSEGAGSKGTSNSLASINDKFEMKRTPIANTDLVSSDNGLINTSPEDSSRYSVECDNGIKLYVDLKNRSLIEFRKADNYEFCSPEQNQECNSYAEPLQLQHMKGLSTSKDIYDLGEKKMLSNKAVSLNPHDSFRDCHLSTHSLGCVASTSPKNVSKKIEPSREGRRASSIVIPPHGANRCLQPHISLGSKILPSPLFPHGASRFLSPYSTGGNCRQRACKEQEIDNDNQSKESFMPMTEQSSKIEENFCIRSRALESELLHERTDSVFTNTTMEETVVKDTCVEARALKGLPINILGVPDVNLDHELFNTSEMKNLKNEPIQPWDPPSEMEEVQHNNEKDIERFSEAQYLEKKNKEINFPELMEEMESKDQRIVPRFKHVYKKSPPFKKLRYMKNLARIFSSRKGILDSKRSHCIVPSSPSGASNASGDSIFAARDDHTPGNQFKNTISGWPVLGFGRKRFLERALAESIKRLQVQKMLRSGIYDGSVANKEDTKGHNNEKTREISKPMDQITLSMVQSGNEVYNERVNKQQKRRQEQFKTPLLGKSREKAKETAKKMALYHRNQILRLRRENASTNLSDTNVHVCTQFQGEDNDLNEETA